MAVTTVSSLTESFSSGVPVSTEDVVFNKEKPDSVDVVPLDDTEVPVAEGTSGGPIKKDGEDHPHAEESEDSDVEVLEVHD